MDVQLTEGWTGPVDVQLLADGVAVNLTSCTVALVLTGRDGVAVTTTGNVTIIDAAAGKVRYSPDAADLDADQSPYRARYKVTDVLGKIVYFPSGVGGRVRVFTP